MSHKSVPQECPRRVSHKSVLQECHLDICSFSIVLAFGFVGSILFTQCKKQITLTSCLVAKNIHRYMPEWLASRVASQGSSLQEFPRFLSDPKEFSHGMLECFVSLCVLWPLRCRGVNPQVTKDHEKTI